jgi:hypothetical protein
VSFFSDLLEGHTGNLGNDLNPSNILSDAGSDFAKQPTWAKDLEIAAPLAIGTVLTAGADLPGLAGAGGIFGSLGAGGAAAGADALGFAGDVGADAATAGGTDALGAIDTAIGAGGAAPGSALSLAAPDIAAAAPTAAGAAWPASLDLGAGTAADVGTGAGGAAATGAGAPLSLTGAATDTAGTTGSGGIFDSLTKGVTSAFTKNPLGTTLGVGGLALTGYEGIQQKEQLNALNKQEAQNAITAGNTAALAQSIAAPLLNNGQALTTYLTSGTLPPQFQSQVDQTIASQKAGIIQGYASRGMSTDPKQNSQLQQDLAAVDNSKNELMTQLESQLSTAGNQMIQTANGLLSQGLSATQLESQIPIQISQLNQELNQSMSQAISNFAAAINGGGQSGKSVTLNLAGATG